MLYRSLQLVVATLALTLFAGQAAFTQDKEATHEGKVVKAGDGKLTMTAKGKDARHTHDVDKDAKITLDGKATKLEDLKEGYHVIVTTHGKHGIVKIEAHSKDKN